MRVAGDYLPRRAAELIRDALDDTRIVVVTGARQVGKSTLAELVLRQYAGGTARFLDDPVTGVLEDNTGQVVGIEVKATETVRADDFRGLMLLQRRVGSRFCAGLVLYCGTQQLSFGEALSCLPISALWTAHEPA